MCRARERKLCFLRVQRIREKCFWFCIWSVKYFPKKERQTEGHHNQKEWGHQTNESRKIEKKGKLWVYWPWARLNDFLTKLMQSLSKWASTDVLFGLCSKLPGIPHKSMSYSAVGTILCGRNTRISYESGVHPEYHASGHQSMHKTPWEAFWVGCAATQHPFMVKQTSTYGMCLSPLGPTHTPP